MPPGWPRPYVALTPVKTPQSSALGWQDSPKATLRATPVSQASIAGGVAQVFVLDDLELVLGDGSLWEGLV